MMTKLSEFLRIVEKIRPRLSGLLRILRKLRLFHKSLEVVHLTLFLELVLLPHALVAGLAWTAQQIESHEKAVMVTAAVLVVAAKLAMEDRTEQPREEEKKPQPPERKKPSRPRDKQGRFTKIEKTIEKTRAEKKSRKNTKK